MGKQWTQTGNPGCPAYIHGCTAERDCLRIMNELTNQYGFQAAASAMEMACARGNINICDASVLAARITGYGITTPPETGPSLEIYDEAFLKGGSKAL